MPVIKHQYPILEYDTDPKGIIMPNRKGFALLPSVCVMTFFGEVLNEYVEKHETYEISAYCSEMRRFPIYKTEYKGAELCLVQAVVGSASIAMMTDFLIGHGVQKLIACGGCGVLDDIPAGDVIIPTSALRDEGASYHYLPPAREIILDKGPIEAIKEALKHHAVPYIECKTWTTDAFYRETPGMVLYRKSEGCQVVEMECATMAVVSRFRNTEFGQLLYSGDILSDAECYDDRDWYQNITAREKLFLLSLEAASILKKD
ncbi:MAG: nucleoside phosphorylase [Eubacteriales bacterium]